MGLKQSQGSWLSSTFFSSPDGVRKETGSCRRWMGHDWIKMCPSSASLRAHISAGWQGSSVQPGPEPKILFNWMTSCLFNNHLLQGGYKTVRKWLSSWEEQSNWGNHNHSLAIFAAADHDHPVMCTCRGSDEGTSALPFPLSPQCLHPALGYSMELTCLTSLTVPQFNLT